MKFWISAFLTVVIALASADNKCEEDEQYYENKPDCTNTCENYPIRDRIRCRSSPAGCFCKEGLVKRKDGMCVPLEMCNQDVECGENEAIVPCAKPKWCNTCGIRGNCKLAVCSEGCDCKEGFYRDQNEACIPESMCLADNPPKCEKDEEYVECVPCANTCETYEQRFYCKPACKPGCTCNEGLVKRKDGNCVPPEEC